MPTQCSKILRYSGLFLLPITFLFTAAAQESGPSVDDIVNKSIDARGGSDKIKAIQSVKMTGKLVMGGGQMEAPMTLQMKRPSSMRMDMEFQGQSVVQSYDGTTVWTINPFTGGADAQKMTGDEADDVIDNSDMEGTLVGYKEKGHKIALLGKEDLAGKPAYKLKVDKKNGKTETIYVDAATFMEVKTVAMRKMMGSDMEMETFVSDFKPVAGVLMPHVIDSKSGGNSLMTLNIDKIEANVAIDDAVFKMPVAK
jgi:outer membrane lipoprotein-sorting protein